MLGVFEDIASESMSISKCNVSVCVTYHDGGERHRVTF